MIKEIWKNVVGYEGLYEVSNLGRVRSLDRIKIAKKGSTQLFKGRILSPKYRPERGYPDVRLSVDGVCKSYTVHRLVAKAFIPNPENKPDVNHKNGVKADARAENLEWVTKSENTHHAYRTKLMKAHPRLGEECHFSKLTQRMVTDMRKAQGQFIKELSKKYKVCKSTIRAVLKQTAWKHIGRSRCK